MSESRTYRNPSTTRGAKHVTTLDYAAIDQWRTRHELLKQALMSAQRKLKGRGKNKVPEAIELINAALVADKKVVPLDER